MSCAVRVKMCGMTRLEDINHAVFLGVHALGFIFYPQSPRNLSIAQAKALMNKIPPFITRVAVVVDPEALFLQEILDELPVDLIQFHGSESLSFCRQFNTPFIKSIPAESELKIQQAMAEFDLAQALLLDTPCVQLKGGTGKQFNWQIIPKITTKPYILAGGLNQHNITNALQQCKPYAVDVCSGIESEPGIKDHHKMTGFIKTLGV